MVVGIFFLLLEKKGSNHELSLFHLQIVTNGIYKSTEHRATVNSVKERISIATFYSPSLDGEMGPAASLVTPERPAAFKRIGVADFFRGYFSRALVEKSYLDVVRIQNEATKNN